MAALFFVPGNNAILLPLLRAGLDSIDESILFEVVELFRVAQDTTSNPNSVGIVHHHNMTNILHMGVALIEMEGPTDKQLGIGGAIFEGGVRRAVPLIPRIDQPRDHVEIVIPDKISWCVGIGRVDVRAGAAGRSLVNVDAGRNLRFQSGKVGLQSERGEMEGHGDPTIDIRRTCGIPRITANICNQRVFVGMDVRGRVLLGHGVFDGMRQSSKWCGSYQADRIETDDRPHRHCGGNAARREKRCASAALVRTICVVVVRVHCHDST